MTVNSLTLDAEALYADLRSALAPLCNAQTHLVGITSGGAWLAERLHADWQRSGAPGIISSAMHRDDFSRRGLSNGGPTRLPFDVQQADLWLLDDVLFTGRTVRAALNELFDYGRPDRIRLAVLVDRGGRELPIQADLAAARLQLPVGQSLALARAADGRWSFELRAS